MDKLARLMERNGIDSLRQKTMQEQENRIAELERTIEILLKGEMPDEAVRTGIPGTASLMAETRS